MANYEIVDQLRKLRIVQREQLYHKLYPMYIEGKKNALREITEKLSRAERLYIDALDKHNSGSFFKSIRKSNKQRYDALDKELECLRQEKNFITNTYESTCEFNAKLKEFDIETESIVLAHLCGVQSICGDKKLLPMITDD